MSFFVPKARRRTAWTLIGVLLLSGPIGCASGYRKVKPTTLEVAPVEMPEELLLDVGLAISDAPELSEKQLEKQGTTPDVRKSECTYIPYHLKNTLQQSSYWGSVQLVPPDEDAVDLKITSELISSNGERMQIKVEAVDASGRVWLRQKYQADVTAEQYDQTALGQRDPFQDLYNLVANDLSAFEHGLTPEELEEIRTVSKLRFASEFAPDAFGDYVVEDAKGKTSIQRLPADDDPIMERLEKVREREYMFIDTLNQYYEGFYTQMWEPYEDWRRYNLAERVALRKVKQEAFLQTLTGILMIAAAVALEVSDVDNVETVRDVLVLGGGQVVVNGINLSQQEAIHAAAIEELSASFGADMRPTVMELEGKQYELTGTASEQYHRWKELLRRIYHEETGFEPDSEPFDDDGVDPNAGPVVAPVGP